MNFTSSKDLSFMEITRAAALVEEQADEDAEILFGHVIEDDSWEQERVVVTIVATGFQEEVTSKDAWNSSRDGKRMDTANVQEVYVAQTEQKTSFSPPNREETSHEPAAKEEDERTTSPFNSNPNRNPASLKDLQESNEDLNIPSFLRGRQKR